MASCFENVPATAEKMRLFIFLISPKQALTPPLRSCNPGFQPCILGSCCGSREAAPEVQRQPDEESGGPAGAGRLFVPRSLGWAGGRPARSSDLVKGREGKGRRNRRQDLVRRDHSLFQKGFHHWSAALPRRAPCRPRSRAHGAKLPETPLCEHVGVEEQVASSGSRPATGPPAPASSCYG